MSDVAAAENDGDSPVEGGSSLNFHRTAEVIAWLSSQFDAAGKVVPDFKYTPQSISFLHNLARRSQAKTQASLIIESDLLQKAAEYRLQAARISEVLKAAGLARENLPENVVSSAEALANVANLLGTRDTELGGLLVAIGEMFLRKAEVAERRNKTQMESRILLDHTRKAIARLTNLKRTLQQLQDDASSCEAQMEKWKKNLVIMAAKEQQYMQQHANFRKVLNHIGYSPELSHKGLFEMAEHMKELEKRTMPIIDTLRSYHDLPPDKELATLAIQNKQMEVEAADKYLEDVLQSALGTTE